MSRFALPALALVAMVAAASADTSLRVRRDGQAFAFDLPPSDVQLTAFYEGTDGNLMLFVDCTPGESCAHRQWLFRFGSKLGEPLVDGVYENSQGGYRSAEQPFLVALETSPQAVNCSQGPGRFEIRGLIPGAAGNLYSAAIDFEMECDGGVLTGAIHVSTGDIGCAGAVDGTSCDDEDPCTGRDTCGTGRCVGQRNPSCDAFTCDDGDLCTDDRRDGAACLNSPVAGECWVLTSATIAAAAHASAGGRSASCSLRCVPEAGDVFVLFDDGTYVTEESEIIGGCPDARDVTVPAETGHVAAGRRGSLVLAPDNLSDIEAAYRRCLGSSLSLTDYRVRLRVDEGGESLAGVAKLHYRLHERLPIAARQVTRFRAALRSATPGSAAQAAKRGRALPACSASLRPKCVTD